MFSAWDFNGWLISVGVMLFMLSLVAGFGALVHALLAHIWGEEPEAGTAPRMSSAVKEPSFRKAA